MGVGEETRGVGTQTKEETVVAAFGSGKEPESPVLPGRAESERRSRGASEAEKREGTAGAGRRAGPEVEQGASSSTEGWKRKGERRPSEEVRQEAVGGGEVAPGAREGLRGPPDENEVREHSDENRRRQRQYLSRAKPHGTE